MLKAGTDINLGVIRVGSVEADRKDSRNWTSTATLAEVGSRVVTVGDLSLVAGNNVNARTAAVSSESGTLFVGASNDVNITAGQAWQGTVTETFSSSSSFWRKKTSASRTETDTVTALSSNFTGKEVIIDAGNNINITGSNVISDDYTQLTAGNNITIQSAIEHDITHQNKEDKRSGVLSVNLTSGGFSVGTKKTTSDTDQSEGTSLASTIGSLHGNVTLVA